MPGAFPFDKFKKGLFNCGLTEKSFDSYLLEWLKEHGDNEQSRKDYIWQYYQLLLAEFAKQFQSNLQLMFEMSRKVYCEMFSFLVEDGKDRTAATKGINHCDVQIAALSDLKMNGEIIGGNRCKLASEINGKTYSLKALLIKDAIPYDKCPRDGGCNCVYGFIPLRDSKGKLIKT